MMLIWGQYTYYDINNVVHTAWRPIAVSQINLLFMVGIWGFLYCQSHRYANWIEALKSLKGLGWINKNKIYTMKINENILIITIIFGHYIYTKKKTSTAFPTVHTVNTLYLHLHSCKHILNANVAKLGESGKRVVSSRTNLNHSSKWNECTN